MINTKECTDQAIPLASSEPRAFMFPVYSGTLYNGTHLSREVFVFVFVLPRRCIGKGQAIYHSEVSWASKLVCQALTGKVQVLT